MFSFPFAVLHKIITQHNHTTFLLREIKQTESLKSLTMKNPFRSPIFSWLFSESIQLLSILQSERSYKILIPLPNERHPQLLSSISSQTRQHHPETQGLQGLVNPKAKQIIPFAPVYQAIHVISIRNLSSATYPCPCLLSGEIIWLYYIFFEITD